MNIGVLNTDSTRSIRDNQLQVEFPCDRQVNYPVHLLNSDIGVLGVNNNSRSVKDMQMMEAFSCGMRENYGQQRLRSPGSNPGCPYAVQENYDIPNPYIRDSQAKFIRSNK